MTIANVQTVTGNGATVALTATAGNLLTLAEVEFKSSGAGYNPAIPTDTQGTWSAAVNPAMAAFNTNEGCGAQLFYQANVGVGSHTVTTDSTMGSHNTTLCEWSGILKASPLDKAPAAVNDATDHTSTTVTTTGTLSQSEELILTVCALVANTGAADVGWTDPLPTYTTLQKNTNDATDTAGLHSYKIVAVTTAEAPTFNWTSHEAVMTTQAVIATFKGSGGEGTFLSSFPGFPNRKLANENKI